jgi:hypothetical protein
MSEENEEKVKTVLSSEEMAEARDLQIQLRRGISELLADPRTPESFKKVFNEGND